MLIIRPFRGITYDVAKVGNLAKVVAPPYDVISPSEQGFYYQLHPCNIIRIILGRDYSADNEKENKYTRARDYFERWLSSGVLSRERRPAIYVYDQRYSLKGKIRKRRGFVALMRMEEFGSGVVFPHEQTFSQVRLDRLRLLRSCRANFSPIFSLYSDPSHKVDEYLGRAIPLLALRDKDGVEHTLGMIRDEAIIEKIAEAMRDKKVFIADGHHRYLTALRFWKERKRQVGDEKFVMMYFLNTETNLAAILPVHRVIDSLKGKEFTGLREKLSDFFWIKTFDFTPETDGAQREMMLREMQEAKEACVFGMYSKGDRYYLLRLKEQYKSCFEGRVDTAILNELVLRKLNRGDSGEKKVEFVRDEKRVVDLVRSGDHRVAFFLRAPSLRQIREVSHAGGVMPPKSSYFYPKLLSGLVMRQLKG